MFNIKSADSFIKTYGPLLKRKFYELPEMERDKLLEYFDNLKNEDLNSRRR
jgi:hypothetical protein